MDIGKDQKKEVRSPSHPCRITLPLLTPRTQGEKEFSIQPIDDNANKSKDPKFDAFGANPGPARTNDMPAQEGSRDDRNAKKEALNK